MDGSQLEELEDPEEIHCARRRFNQDMPWLVCILTLLSCK